MNVTYQIAKERNTLFCLLQANPGIFCAGLDILEMYQKSPDQTNAFWHSLQEVWLKLYGSSLITIAAINVSIVKVALRFIEVPFSLPIWGMHELDKQRWI